MAMKAASCFDPHQLRVPVVEACWSSSESCWEVAGAASCQEVDLVAMDRLVDQLVASSSPFAEESSAHSSVH